MIKYKINCGLFEYGQGFGIDVMCNNMSVKQIFDITDDKQQIEELVKMCNHLNVEPCHLDDIVEDYLTDFCI